MPVSDVLKGFRKKGYSTEKPEAKPDQESGPRLIKLTDDEAKGIASGQNGEGQEVTCEVTGRLSGNEFSVTSVQAPGGTNADGEEKEMAAQVMQKMGGMPPMMQNQTMPSPS